MTLFKNKYRIESTRLRNWNYAKDGCYFVTICTKNREHSFGEIVDGILIETMQSKIVKECWLNLPNHYHNCILDGFVIMPNHIHGIIIIDNSADVIDDIVIDMDFDDTVETGLKPVSFDTTDTMDTGVSTVKPVTPSPINNNGNKQYSLSEIVRGFKTFTARTINEAQNTTGKPFWQPRFYEHIIRNEHSLNEIREYIIKNPQMWEFDRNNLENLYM